MNESLKSFSVRRRRSMPELRSRVHDNRVTVRAGHELIPITDRLDRVEELLREVLQAIDLNAKHLNALQAQFDHLAARIRTI
jgi:hypothetical protein